MVGTDLSPADISALSGNNRNNGFMGDNWVWLIVLFLFC